MNEREIRQRIKELKSQWWEVPVSAFCLFLCAAFLIESAMLGGWLWILTIINATGIYFNTRSLYYSMVTRKEHILNYERQLRAKSFNRL